MKQLSSMNLCKYLALSGVAARRKAVLIIKEGLVTVNDVVIQEPGYQVQPNDKVKYEDRIIKPEKKVYIVLNKPKNYITTLADEENRTTVMDLIHNPKLPRLFPVGRLDRNTTGLLLITNDGILAQKLAHPRNHITKAYRATLDRPLESIDLDKLHLGVPLPDGRIKPDKAYMVPGSNKHEIVVELHSGKNRIVRRIFEFLGYKIRALDRFKLAGLTKQGLERGAWRFLTPIEVERLIKQVKQ